MLDVLECLYCISTTRSWWGAYSHEDITLTMFCSELDELVSLLSLDIHAWPCNYYRLLFVCGYKLILYACMSLVYGTTTPYDAFVLVWLYLTFVKIYILTYPIKMSLPHVDVCTFTIKFDFMSLMILQYSIENFEISLVACYQ